MSIVPRVKFRPPFCDEAGCVRLGEQFMATLNIQPDRNEYTLIGYWEQPPEEALP